MKKSLLVVALFVGALSVAQAQKLTGAGATFPAPVYSKWFVEYSNAHPGVQINYQSIGSGGGIQQVTNGVVDFGASDMPMTDATLPRIAFLLGASDLTIHDLGLGAVSGLTTSIAYVGQYFLERKVGQGFSRSQQATMRERWFTLGQGGSRR